MTDFRGIRFMGEYDYGQAKAFLENLRDELVRRARKDFREYTYHRGRITDDGPGVWDVLSRTEDHTDSIHITIGVNDRETGEVALTLPKGAKGGAWGALADSMAKDSSADSLLERLLALRVKRHNSVHLLITQRHKDRGHRSGPWIHDGHLRFDISTYYGDDRVKRSPSWWDAFRRIVASKARGTNREMQINVVWSPERARRAEFVDDALQTIRGFGPIVSMMSPK